MQKAVKVPAWLAYAWGGWLRWVLSQGWWLLLGPWLGTGLRSALGGAAGALPTGPPTRPRRPKALRAHRGPAPFPYPSAA